MLCKKCGGDTTKKEEAPHYTNCMKWQRVIYSCSCGWHYSEEKQYLRLGKKDIPIEEVARQVNQPAAK